MSLKSFGWFVLLFIDDNEIEKLHLDLVTSLKISVFEPTTQNEYTYMTSKIQKKATVITSIWGSLVLECHSRQ